MIWLDKILEKGEAYGVGGSVRDELMGRPINDLDILVCHVPADELQSLLESLGRVELVGKNFGVFVFKPTGSEEHYEIALPRREKSTGIGHGDFDVQVDHNIPIEEDLKRRDFTMNAIAKSLRDGQIIDPWGGRPSSRLKNQMKKPTSKNSPRWPNAFKA